MPKRFPLYARGVTHCLILGILLATPLMSYGERYDNDTSLDYSWEPAPGPVDHYNVYVSVNNSVAFQMVGTTPTLNYTLTGAKDLSTYRLKVQAVDASGNTGPLSNVSDPTTVALPVQMQLSAGYNLIALPYTPKSPVTAHSLIRDMGFQRVARWDAPTQTWDAVTMLVDQTPIGTDFPIQAGRGYFVQSSRDSVWLPIPIFVTLAPPIPAGIPISAAGAVQAEVLTTGPANLPHPIYGQVYRYDGVTPAHQATVSIALTRQSLLPEGSGQADLSEGAKSHIRRQRWTQVDIGLPMSRKVNRKMN